MNFLIRKKRESNVELFKLHQLLLQRGRGRRFDVLTFIGHGKVFFLNRMLEESFHL